MPLLYGEEKKAFQRLQEEIMKIDADESLFVWHLDEGQFPRGRDLLAASPSRFHRCSGAERIYWKMRKPSFFVNEMLQLEVVPLQIPHGMPEKARGKLVDRSFGYLPVPLACKFSHQPLGLLLGKIHRRREIYVMFDCASLIKEGFVRDADGGWRFNRTQPKKIRIHLRYQVLIENDLVAMEACRRHQYSGGRVCVNTDL
jgi:hypothetical protein